MNVLDAAHHVALDYPGGTESLAPRLAKAASTLRQELTQQGTAKFGLLDAVKMTKVSGDARILVAFAEDCVFYPPLPLAHPELTEGTLAELLTRGAELSSAMADAFEEFQRDLADQKVTRNELGKFQQRAMQAIAAVIGLTRAMEAKADLDQRPNPSNIASLLKREA